MAQVTALRQRCLPRYVAWVFLSFLIEPTINHVGRMGEAGSSHHRLTIPFLFCTFRHFWKIKQSISPFFQKTVIFRCITRGKSSSQKVRSIRKLERGWCGPITTFWGLNQTHYFSHICPTQKLWLYKQPTTPPYSRIAGR